MARIKINDLPKDMKISKEEMEKVVGGMTISVNNVRLSPFSTSASLLSEFYYREVSSAVGSMGAGISTAAISFD